MSRRRAREAAMCLLYERELNLEPEDDTLEEMCDVLHTEKLAEDNCQYISSVLAAFEQYKEEIDALVAKILCILENRAPLPRGYFYSAPGSY